MRLTEKAGVEVLYDRIRITLNMSKTEIENVINFFNKLKVDTEYDLDAKERARRSLNANSYYWCLVNKLAQAMGVSNYEIHNSLLADYGQDWVDESGDKSYVLMKDTDDYRRMDKIHFRATEHTESRNGKEYRWFVLLTPSHLMTKAQMARLISGTVQECEAVGIDTKPQQDIDKMIETWEKKEG